MTFTSFRAAFGRPALPLAQPMSTRLARACAPLLVFALAAPAGGQPATVPSPPPLSLSEALATQARRHELLQAADAQVRQREQERAAAHTLYYPRVDVHLRATRIDAPITIDLSPIRDAMLALHPQVPGALVPPFRTTVQDETFWKADVRAAWPLFTGGRVPAANAAATARVDEALAERRLTQGTLAVELVRRYFGLRLARAATAVRAQVVEGMSRHVFDATRLEQEGLIARVERLSAEVALAEAERQHRRARDEEALAGLALAATLSLDTPPDPSTPLFVARDLDPVAVFRERAHAAHPALARLDTQARLAAQAERAEAGKRWPEVYAFGLRELHEGDLTILEPAWAVGLGASWTLFDGGERARRTAAAREQAARVAAMHARVRRDLATLVEAKYREVRRARDQFDTLHAMLGLADEHLRVRSRAFEEGLATSLEVVDARLALARAQLERLVAAYDYDVALAELLEASGQADRYDDFRARPGTQDVDR